MNNCSSELKLHPACRNFTNPPFVGCVTRVTTIPANWASPSFDDSHWDFAIEWDKASINYGLPGRQMRAIYMNRKVDGQTHRRVDERTHNKWEDGQTLSMQGCTPTMIPFPYTFPFLLRACKWWYKVNHMSCVSLVPRPSHRPVFDCLQCAQLEVERLGPFQWLQHLPRYTMGRGGSDWTNELEAYL